jgi:hypothetical protein
MTPANVFTNFRIPEFEVILQLLGIEDAGDRDTIFLEDEIFLVDMRPADDLAEVYAGFGKGEAVYRRFFDFDHC